MLLPAQIELLQSLSVTKEQVLSGIAACLHCIHSHSWIVWGVDAPLCDKTSLCVKGTVVHVFWPDLSFANIWSVLFHRSWCGENCCWFLCMVQCKCKNDEEGKATWKCPTKVKMYKCSCISDLKLMLFMSSTVFVLAMKINGSKTALDPNDFQKKNMQVWEIIYLDLLMAGSDLQSAQNKLKNPYWFKCAVQLKLATVNHWLKIGDNGLLCTDD